MSVAAVKILNTPIKFTTQKIKLKIHANEKVTIDLFDFSGKKIDNLIYNKLFNQGEFMTSYNVKNLTNGIYLIVTKIGDETYTNRFIKSND